MSIAENILDRNFEADALNEKWVTDITFIPTHQGWTYLATLMDLCARRIVGWATSKRIDTALISEALHKAIKERQPEEGFCYTTPTEALNMPPRPTERYLISSK
jgi:transposase InsO family protein